MAQRKPSNADKFPSVDKNVYSRFDDDGWGITNVKRTKKGQRALNAALKQQKKKKKQG